MIRAGTEDPKARFERYLHVKSAYTPLWSPQGRLAFLSDITGVPQLWALARPGEWPEALTHYSERISTAACSPKSEEIVFGMDVGGNERDQLFHLVLDPEGRIFCEKLTDAPEAIHTLGGFSPSGEEVAFASNRRDPAQFDVYTLNLRTGEERRVWESDGMVHVLGFSPDGAQLLIARVHASFHQELFALERGSEDLKRLTPPKEARFLNAHWGPDGHVYALTDLDREFLAPMRLDPFDQRLEILDETNWDAETLALAPDGKTLAYALNVDGYSQLWLLDLETGEKSRVEGLPPGVVGPPPDPKPLEFSVDGTRLAVAFTGARYNPDIWVYDRDTRGWERWTRSSRAGLSPEDWVEPDLVRYPSFDGREIPAYLYRPRGAKKGLPIIVWVHGGPEAQSRPLFNPVLQYFVERGYGVFVPNVRGSTGYGKTYTHLDDVEKRMDAVEDLKYGALWLIERGIADKKRLAVLGGSYGGFMVLATLTTHPELWAAGVDIVGIANFVTFLENTGPWRRRLREAEYGSLERDRALLESISPIHQVERIRAPLLVIHGANDPRVPVGEAEQIVSRLRQRGRPVEYLRFDDEGHGIIKLKNKRIAYAAIAEFLDRHLMR